MTPKKVSGLEKEKVFLKKKANKKTTAGSSLVA